MSMSVTKTLQQSLVLAPIEGNRLRYSSIRALLLFVFLGLSTGWAAEPPRPPSISGSSQAAAPAPAILPADGVSNLRSYIRDAWQSLTRSMTQCASLTDTKLKQLPVLYLPHELPVPTEVQQLEAACGIRVQQLPKRITRLGDLRPGEIGQHGLLYLPNPYVVPGGRFNEMYGWDSYFIIRGLLSDDKPDLARGMIENFFFELEHYGAVLNANRTYYFTRSQPPFLTSMIMGYYQYQKTHGQDQREWLERAYGYAQRDYQLWTREPHVAGNTGLARYFDVGEGPVPEMGDDPHYYAQVATHLLLHPDSNYTYVVPAGSDTQPTAGLVFTLKLCGETKIAGSDVQPCSDTEKLTLSSDYYKGDRAMRESGFDISFRFGPFGGSTHHFAPVCLNSLLYKAEMDMAEMASILGHGKEAQQWKDRARIRQAALNKYLWNAQTGLFVDYDFSRQRQSNYDYAATFYPLWTGLATPQQAQSLVRKLSTFEKAGGIAMSDRVTGVQWDLPYGWAPLQLITVEGLRRYGFNNDADRVSREFISTVLENFQRDGTIREKYNVVTRSSESNVSTGYKVNVVGFGWTNGVTLELLHGLKD
jgi:alpha,alpha-trehalase